MLREQIDFSDSLFPLLATGTALLYMLLAAPLGRLADKVGRGRVLIGGYVLLLGGLLHPDGAVGRRWSR